MTRLSLSDIAQMLIDQAERDRKERAELLTALVSLTQAVTEAKRPQAAQTVELDRAGSGSNVTVIKVAGVVQEDETLLGALARVGETFEVGAARYPLPSGLTHPHPLGEGIEAPPSLAEQMQKTLDDEVGAKRRGKPKP